MSKIAKLPNTKTVELGNLTLNCRLDGRSTLAIEKRLDESLMGLFMKGQGEMKLPPINKLLLILSATNTTHGIKESDVVTAFYDFIDNGGTTLDVFEQVQELLDEAGFFGKSDDKATAEVAETLDNEDNEDSIL